MGSLQNCLFLGELEGMETWATDIGNVYLEALASEKVCIRAGPEFGPNLEGHLLIISKALHGLTTASPNGDVVVSFSIIGFVDDSTCVKGGKQGETIEQLLVRVEHDA